MSCGKNDIDGPVSSTSLLRPNLMTLKQFCQRYPAFPQGGMRWLLFHREQNGLKHAVVKVGRKVLIDVDRFFLWLEQQNGRNRKPTNPDY